MKIIYLLSSLKAFIAHYFLLKSAVKKTRKELEVMQLERLKKVIDFAWENIPFYRDYWSQCHFHPSQLQSLQDVNLIPFTDKNTIREHLAEIVNPHYDKTRLSLVTTGGTTGMPMKFYIDNYLARGKEMAYQIWGGKHYWNYRFGRDKVVLLRGFNVKRENIERKQYWQKSMRDNGLVFSSFHISEDTFYIYLNKLRDYKPCYIKAYPSSIVAFCSLMKKHNEYGIDGLKGVICSSENVYDSHRKLIKETLGVDVYSFYGHSEKSVCAFEQNGKMYFQPLYGFTEFLNNEWKGEVNKGDIANVVVTSFDNLYFPFIRYKTNDLIEVDDLINKVANRIIGRSQEFIIDKDSNKVVFTCADEVFWDIKGVVAYQYIQHEVGSLQLNIQVNDLFSSNDLKIIKKGVEDMFYNFDITVSVVNHIEKTKSGKFRYLIQHLSLD